MKQKAQRLTAKEIKAGAHEYGLQVEWEDDYDADTSWMDAEQLEAFEEGSLIPYVCRVFNADRSMVAASLGGIFLDNSSASDKYREEVELELLEEALGELMNGRVPHCEECEAVQE